LVKTLGQLYRETRRQLMAKEDSETASFYAKAIVCHITGKTREEFLAQQELYAGEEACNRLQMGITRLMNDEPLAYVLGEWDFYGMTLKVNENVLIPRDDTCAVTDLAIEELDRRAGEKRVLGLCTGSGCIGLAIAKNIPEARVTLADISRPALAVAKENITLQKLSGRVACVEADALSAPPAFLGKFDMIISNPPYITENEMRQLPKSVDAFEPDLALFGGEDGLNFYRSIAENYRAALKNGGCLCFEFGEGQGDAVAKILEENGFTILKRRVDYNERERAIIARYQREED
jgi:release factor glutamine methyltransferase